MTKQKKKPLKAAKEKTKKKNLPPGGKPISQAEKLFRLTIVEQCIIQGKRASAIAEVLASHGRIVPARTLYEYIKAVRVKWEKEQALYSPVTRERQLRDLYETLPILKKEKQWTAWTATQKLIAEIEGNKAEPESQKVAKESADFDKWSEEELNTYIKTKGKKEPDWISKIRDSVETETDGETLH